MDTERHGVGYPHSDGQAATFRPEEGGHASIFKGRVVDMGQSPPNSWKWPEGKPGRGGEP
jgi:hypothetical protein